MKSIKNLMYSKLMDRLKRGLFIAIATLATSTVALSQTTGEVAAQPLPTGTIVYSLPSTTITLRATAEYEDFIAGPYAQYAKKYLGIEARAKSEKSYKLSSIEMVPYLEADATMAASVNVGNSKESVNFVNFCSQGLIITSDSYTGKEASWRFPSMVDNRDLWSGTSANLENRSSTLYKSVETAEGVERVPIQQTQVVEKSIENKAAEAAAVIFNLRQMRLDVVTGFSDIIFEGESMKAALDEITRLESEYMSLFLGKSVKDTQTVLFDVIPTAQNAKQMYIAFRVSDRDGLVPADNMSGRPIVLEIVTDKKSLPTGSENLAIDAREKGQHIIYRKPATMLVKLMDGKDLIMQNRIPIYQFGKVLTFPL